MVELVRSYPERWAKLILGVSRANDVNVSPGVRFKLQIQGTHTGICRKGSLPEISTRITIQDYTQVRSQSWSRGSSCVLIVIGNKLCFSVHLILIVEQVKTQIIAVTGKK